MKRPVPTTVLVTLAALLAGCGGGGGGGGTGGGIIAAPTPTPTPTSQCSLRARQDWARGVVDEWYLFPETVPATLDPAQFTSVQAYIDALTATARGQGRDRFFSFITSIAEENAFFNSGSSAGFGVRVSTDVAAQRVFIAEAFEGAPALNAGIDRGTEILAIGDTPSSLRTVASIIAAEGQAGITNALGPSNPGVTRTLRVNINNLVREVTVTKADFTLTPVSSRYGAVVLDDGGKRVGYLNLRTFISTADPALRTAFDGFRAQGITEFVIDFRYNGGGLVSTAELMGDLLGRDRLTSDVYSRTLFRASKSPNNSVRNFNPQPQSVAPVKIAFIGTGATASASELVINSFIPYLNANAGLIGSNTFGKPVGQSAFDRAACDDRLRLVTFETRNAANVGQYFSGLAATVQASCRAPDDVTRPLGNAQEGSVRAALDFLGGRQCTAIAGDGQGSLSAGARPKELLTPERPTVSQREVPGLF